MRPRYDFLGLFSFSDALVSMTRSISASLSLLYTLPRLHLYRWRLSGDEEWILVSFAEYIFQ
jgi:hypothetical protein